MEGVIQLMTIEAQEISFHQRTIFTGTRLIKYDWIFKAVACWRK